MAGLFARIEKIDASGAWARLINRLEFYKRKSAAAADLRVCGSWLIESRSRWMMSIVIPSIIQKYSIFMCVHTHLCWVESCDKCRQSAQTRKTRDFLISLANYSIEIIIIDISVFICRAAILSCKRIAPTCQYCVSRVLPSGGEAAAAEKRNCSSSIEWRLQRLGWFWKINGGNLRHTRNILQEIGAWYIYGFHPI